ncbi:MAG: hypothetical protein ACK2TV_07865 [Anaerolineales bacterium]
MKVFNVGGLEFVFILLIALIVLGPKKAVKAAGDVGIWIRKLMSSQFWKDLLATSREIQDLPKKLMDEAEIQKTLAEIDRSTNDINTAMQGINQELEKTSKPLEQNIVTPDQNPSPKEKESDHSIDEA